MEERCNRCKQHMAAAVAEMVTLDGRLALCQGHLDAEVRRLYRGWDAEIDQLDGVISRAVQVLLAVDETVSETRVRDLVWDSLRLLESVLPESGNPWDGNEDAIPFE